jgi:hypothetical protein
MSLHQQCDAPANLASPREAAIAAARRGWFVFPVRPGGKEPRPGLNWPAAATANPDKVAAARWRPGENFGVACKPSNLVVLDLDRCKPGYQMPPSWRDLPGIVDGADVLAELAERAGQSWPATFTVRTPSGGFHLYFKSPRGIPIGNRPAGPLVDVRAAGGRDGGYVVGPGSVIGGRAYEVIDDQPAALLPGWIAELLGEPPAASRHRPVVIRGDGISYGRLRGLVELVLNSQPHDRNNPLFWAACRAGEMVAAHQIEAATAEQVLVQAAVAAGLRGGEREARRTVASGLSRGARA